MSKATWTYILSNCIFILFSLTPTLTLGESIDDVYNRFKNNAFNIWKEDFRDTNCYSGQLTSKVQIELPREKLPSTGKYEVNELVWNYLPSFRYSIAVTNSTALSPRQQADNATEVLCLNPNYIFKIERNSPTSGWKIVSLTPVSNKEQSADLWSILMTASRNDENLLGYFSLAKTCFAEYIMPDDSFFPALFRYPCISVDRYELTKDNCLRIFFSIRTSDDHAATSCPFKFESGEVVLIPDIWLIQSLRLFYGKWEQQMICHYNDIGHDSQQLASKTVRTIFGDGRIMEDTYLFSYSSATVDKSYFTLTNYGLPEPRLKKRNITIVQYCIMGAGFMMIAYGFVLLFQRQRKKHKG